MEGGYPQVIAEALAASVAIVDPRGMDSGTTRQQIARLISDQDGVISRRQVLAAGGVPHDIRRHLRRREWAQVFSAVYVNHTGQLTWNQRAWAAVLALWPAALAGNSALRAEAGPGWRGCKDSDPIQVLIAGDRHPRAPDGVVLRRCDHIDDRVRWNTSPPRVKVEEATLDVACAKDNVLDMVEVLAASVRARCTTASRLLEALSRREWIKQRGLLAQLLADVRDGSCSALEHGYLTCVERPHGLPPLDRQFHERVEGGSVYRDGLYDEWGLVIELDGAMFHSRSRQHDRDLDRDLAVVIEGRITVRLGWGQTFDRSCQTAWHVAQLLQARGWQGHPVPCGAHCPIAKDAAA